ncbi:MAG TPA: hypothetical protein VGE76_24040 [Opitutaceae bacterium]
MRLLTLLAACLALALPSARAAQPPSVDPVLTQGLQSMMSNGVYAGLRVWFANRPAIGTEMYDRLGPVIRPLGNLIDHEIVAVQPISTRVTRYYVALYFTRCPLWLRVERYANDEQAFYLPLRFSTNPDEILPGYVTQFYTQ